MHLLCLLSEVTISNLAVRRYLNRHFVYLNCLIQTEHFAGDSAKGDVKSKVLKLEGEPEIERFP